MAGEKNKTVLWFSRYRPLECQIKALQEMYGPAVRVSLQLRNWNTAEQILNVLELSRWDDFVMILPISLLARLTEEGVKPLWPQMREVSPNESYDLVFSRKHYRFERFRRLVAVDLIFEDEFELK